MRAFTNRIPSLAAALVFASAMPAPCAVQADASRAQATARLALLGLEAAPRGLCRFVEAGHRSLIDLFLAAGVDVNAADERGRTPLLLATLHEDWPLALRLIETGADPARADATGTTPAMVAALRGHLPTLRALLAKGADPNTADANGHTALHYAIAAQRRDAMILLLESAPPTPGACCEERDLLSHAFESMDWRLIDPILSRAAPALEWDDWSRAVLLHTLAAGDRRHVQALLAHYLEPPTPAAGAQPLIAYAVARNDLVQLTLLLDAGVDPDTVLHPEPDSALRELVKGSFVRNYLGSEPGMTVLMLGGALGRADAVRLLLEKGANRLAATRSRSHLLAVYFAAWADNAECIQLLLGKSLSRDRLRIEISLDRQKAELVQDGATVFATEISSGRAGFPTPTGEFVITDKHLEHTSTIYHEAKMPFFMRLSCRDFGMHLGVVPGHPASHGCIRLPSAAARRFFKEVPIGTWVSIAR